MHAAQVRVRHITETITQNPCKIAAKAAISRWSNWLASPEVV
jgi:hypothetical protein